MASNPFRAYDNSYGSVSSNKGEPIIDGMSVEKNSGANVQLGKPSQMLRMRFLFYALAAVFFLLFCRLFFLQIVEGAAYLSQSEGNRIDEYRIPAPRGVIYDRDGTILAKNVPNFTLRVTASDMLHPKNEAYPQQYERLVKIAGAEKEVVDQAIAQSRSTGLSVTVRDQIPYEEAMQMIINIQEVAGAQIEVDYAREYAADQSWSHLIGYTSKMNETEYAQRKEQGYAYDDTIGKSGAEYSYEDYLRGTDGSQRVEVNSRGIQTSIISDVAADPGVNIHLTIDPRLQNSLFTKLQQMVDEKELPGASAVAIDPRNGEIRALVSYPSYDLNAFSGGIDTETYTQYIEDERRPLFHRAISGEYPSGSTFKMVVAAAALEEGVITKNSTVQSTGGLRIDQYYFPDWRAGGHGTTNVAWALADSVNTFFYLAGGGDNETTTGLGVDRITRYGRLFGLHDQTGIDLPGEADGFLPSKSWKEEFKNEQWYLGDTYHLSIGQGDLLVTPLQVAQYTAIIANGGTEYQPHIVSHTSDETGATVDNMEATVMSDQVVSPYTIGVVRNGLREAVLSGSARSLLTLPVTSAGKTGTAQFAGGGDKTHSWFTAFAPYDSPELVIAVLVEEGGGGNDSAVPVVREAMREYFTPEQPENGLESAETSQ